MVEWQKCYNNRRFLGRSQLKNTVSRVPRYRTQASRTLRNFISSSLNTPIVITMAQMFLCETIRAG